MVALGKHGVAPSANCGSTNVVHDNAIFPAAAIDGTPWIGSSTRLSGNWLGN